MDGDILPSDLLDSEPDVRQKAAALAAALRNKQVLGQILQMSGDRTIAPIGQGMAHFGMQQEAAIPGMLEKRPGMLLQAQEAEKNRAQTAQLQAVLGLQRKPEYISGLVKTLARMGRKITPEEANALGSVGLEHMIGLEEKVPKPTVVPAGGTIVPFGQTGPAPGAIKLPFDEDSLNRRADFFNQTSTHLPGLARGAYGTQIAGVIEKRAAERRQQGIIGSDLAGAGAGYSANKASLKNQTTLLNSAESWERTGRANLDVMMGVAQKLKDTGSPWLNRPVRTFMEKGTGDPNQAAFKAAHNTVVNEYAKLLSGAQGSAMVTDSARKEAAEMLPLDATWEQLQAAANILHTDAANRIGALRQQVAQIRSDIGGQQVAPAAKKKKWNPATGKIEEG